MGARYVLHIAISSTYTNLCTQIPVQILPSHQHNSPNPTLQAPYDPIETSSQPLSPSNTQGPHESVIIPGSHSQDHEDEGIEIPESPEQEESESLGRESTQKSGVTGDEPLAPIEDYPGVSLPEHFASPAFESAPRQVVHDAPDQSVHSLSGEVERSIEEDISGLEPPTIISTTPTHSAPVNDLYQASTESVVTKRLIQLADEVSPQDQGLNSATDHSITERTSEQVEAIDETAVEQRGHSVESQAASDSAKPKVATPVRGPASQAVIPETVPQAKQLSYSALQDEVERRDFAETTPQGLGTCSPRSNPARLGEILRVESQSQYSKTSSVQQEQHAQVVQYDPFQSTQDESLGSIRPTTEVDHFADVHAYVQPSTLSSVAHSTISSRAPSEASIESSSPAPQPPSQSLPSGTHSTAPPRPRSPIITSSMSANMTEFSNDDVDQALKNALSSMSAAAESQFVSRKKPLMSERLTASPGGAGTRSPSTIPDRSPGQQPPSSLRTAALMNSTVVQQPEVPLLMNSSAAVEHPRALEDAIIPDVEVEDTAEATKADEVDIDGVDDTDEVGSLLDDDLHTISDEYLVPLPMDGRQRSSYTNTVRCKQELLKDFLDHPEEFNNLEELENILRKLNDIETHLDLQYAESLTQQGPDQAKAEWAFQNSIKLRFLGKLLIDLNDVESNIVLVLDNDDERVFELLESFFKGRFVNYKFPAKRRSADITNVVGLPLVTILSSDSPYVIQKPTTIICFDYVNASKIRSQKWAVNSGQVPILQLVIPRTVDHIKRCISSSLSQKDRLHTIFATLAQVMAEVGKPLEDSPRAVEAAELVANWLMVLDKNDGSEQPEWPLPPLHSIKDVIDYAPLTQSTQASHEPRSMEHTPTPTLAPGRPQAASSKRPLEAEELDPAKRIRITPQPQQARTTPSASFNADAEVTHISDSMPGTAVSVSKLQEQLAHQQHELDRVLTLSSLNEKRHRELEEVWDRRQTDYEDLSKKHRVLLGELEANKTKMEKVIKSKELTNQQIEKLRNEVAELRANLQEQRGINLASTDEKVAELTRWRQEAAEEKKLKEAAQRSKETTDGMLEYQKDQLRNAQEGAASWKDAYESIAAELTALKARDPVAVAEIKKQHQDNVLEAARKQLSAAKVERETLVKMLMQKDEEIHKLKNGRGGYGTRGTSVPRSPRIGAGSRAASPLAKDRVSNLRNG